MRWALDVLAQGKRALPEAYLDAHHRGGASNWRDNQQLVARPGKYVNMSGFPGIFMKLLSADFVEPLAKNNDQSQIREACPSIIN